MSDSILLRVFQTRDKEWRIVGKHAVNGPATIALQLQNNDGNRFEPFTCHIQIVSNLLQVSMFAPVPIFFQAFPGAEWCQQSVSVIAHADHSFQITILGQNYIFRMLHNTFKPRDMDAVVVKMGKLRDDSRNPDSDKFSNLPWVPDSAKGAASVVVKHAGVKGAVAVKQIHGDRLIPDPSSVQAHALPRQELTQGPPIQDPYAGLKILPIVDVGKLLKDGAFALSPPRELNQTGPASAVGSSSAPKKSELPVGPSVAEPPKKDVVSETPKKDGASETPKKDGASEIPVKAVETSEFVTPLPKGKEGGAGITPGSANSAGSSQTPKKVLTQEGYRAWLALHPEKEPEPDWNRLKAKKDDMETRARLEKAAADYHVSVAYLIEFLHGCKKTNATESPAAGAMGA